MKCFARLVLQASLLLDLDTPRPQGQQIYGARHYFCFPYSTQPPQAPIAPTSQCSFMDHGPALDAIISDCLVNSVWSSPLARLRLRCLLCPFVCALSTHDFISTVPSNTTVKFTSESTIVGLITEGNCDRFGWRVYSWNQLNAKQNKSSWYLIYEKPIEEPARSHQRRWQPISELIAEGLCLSANPLSVLEKVWQSIYNLLWIRRNTLEVMLLLGF